MLSVLIFDDLFVQNYRITFYKVVITKASMLLVKRNGITLQATRHTALGEHFALKIQAHLFIFDIFIPAFIVAGLCLKRLFKVSITHTQR